MEMKPEQVDMAKQQVEGEEVEEEVAFLVNKINRRTEWALVQFMQLGDRAA
jgi:hypothetical protein